VRDDNQKAAPHGNADNARRDHHEELGDFTTTLRVVVYRMAEKGVTRLPVVERSTGKFLGLISLDDLLKARTRRLEEERRREQTLKLKYLLPGRRAELPPK